MDDMSWTRNDIVAGIIIHCTGKAILHVYSMVLTWRYGRLVMAYDGIFISFYLNLGNFLIYKWHGRGKK